jgi:uncharacterized membrane protein
MSASAGVLGIFAAALAPLFMTAGFLIWETAWKGTPFMLNLFKCTLASLVFLLICFFYSGLGNASLWSIFMLIVSGMLGILIGDNMWLTSLSIIGARRVIIVDSLKPVLGALFGYIFMGENVGVVGFFGMAITMTLVTIVSLEEDKSSSSSSSSASPSSAAASSTTTEDGTDPEVTDAENEEPGSAIALATFAVEEEANAQRKKEITVTSLLLVMYF